jgi:pSer/pThr/pTyr-binding forkhead associated (FHA) protein
MMSQFVVEDRAGVRQMAINRLLTIGRGQNNDLVLNALFASRRHAWVWRQGDQFIVEDLGSMHGTYVNGQRITTPRFLNDNDVVMVGEARLTFVAERDSSAEKTPPRGVPRLMASQVFCAACGAPNHPQVRFCEQCGNDLWSEAVEVGARSPRSAGWANDQIRTSRPITPTEPVVARPFPPSISQPRPAIERRVWVLILLLAILAVSLVTIVGVLVAYVLA